MRYHAFLLRLWVGGHPHAPRWRASLENIHTHEHVVFTQLEDLISFLTELTQSVETPTSPTSGIAREERP